jgi:hypothetical protein
VVSECSHGGLFLLREDGVVGLQAVLLEEGLAVPDLHVKEGVAHAEEGVGWGRHCGIELVEREDGNRTILVQMFYHGSISYLMVNLI